MLSRKASAGSRHTITVFGDLINASSAWANTHYDRQSGHVPYKNGFINSWICQVHKPPYSYVLVFRSGFSKNWIREVEKIILSLLGVGTVLHLARDVKWMVIRLRQETTKCVPPSPGGGECLTWWRHVSCRFHQIPTRLFCWRISSAPTFSILLTNWVVIGVRVTFGLL